MCFNLDLIKGGLWTRSRSSLFLSVVPSQSPVMASLYVWVGQASRQAPLCRVASGSVQVSQSLLFGPSHKAQSGWQRKHSPRSLSSKNLSGQSSTHRPSWRKWYSSQPAQRTAFSAEWESNLAQVSGTVLSILKSWTGMQEKVKSSLFLSLWGMDFTWACSQQLE